MRLLFCGINKIIRGFPAKALTQYVVVFKMAREFILLAIDNCSHLLEYYSPYTT
jgi:hypothetical protein